jgi:hypothetical protein
MAKPSAIRGMLLWRQQRYIDHSPQTSTQIEDVLQTVEKSVMTVHSASHIQSDESQNSLILTAAAVLTDLTLQVQQLINIHKQQ